MSLIKYFTILTLFNINLIKQAMKRKLFNIALISAAMSFTACQEDTALNEIIDNTELNDSSGRTGGTGGSDTNDSEGYGDGIGGDSNTL